MPAAGKEPFLGDFVDKMMQGQFASGPPLSAEPAAAGSDMAAPDRGGSRWAGVAGSGLIVTMGGE